MIVSFGSKETEKIWKGERVKNYPSEIPQTRISQILKGKRSITADTALRLSLYFGTSPKFWLGLQDDYDLEKESQNKMEIFKRIKRMNINVHHEV